MDRRTVKESRITGRGAARPAAPCDVDELDPDAMEEADEED